MKSNVCYIKKGGVGLEAILAEVEKVSDYNGLENKAALRLRLLAEELAGMLPELVKNFEGHFWLENTGNKYEFHITLSVEGLSKEKKQSLIGLSGAKKNAAATGFMGKIREIAENMLLHSEAPADAYAGEYVYDYSPSDVSYTYAWTLDHYLAQQKDAAGNAEEWDRLEKSIVAKLADDVIVGVRGQKVEIIIKKEF